jgi:hypothetical protein
MGERELGSGVVVLSQWVDTGVLVTGYRLHDPLRVVRENYCEDVRGVL